MRLPRDPASWCKGAPAALALAVLALAATPACRAEAKPDVVVVVMDTTRADHCGWLGYPRPTTPRLDEFSRECAVFRHAWAPEGWTGPCHASLFTGLSVENHGFYTGSRRDLASAVPTLAEVLGRDGYATACFTNNEWISPGFGLTRGFGRVDALYEDEHRPYPWAPATHERAAAWAEEQHAAGKRFFLFINDMEPHLTYDPPAADAAGFLRGSPTPQEIAWGRAYEHPHTTAYCAGAEELTPDRLRLLTDLYDAEIAALDREVGRLLDRLRKTGILDSSIVVVLGDHGEMLGEHHQTSHMYTLYGPARRVPLLVRLPGRFDGGRTVDDLVRVEDVMPTILEACRVAPPEGLDGVSLAHDLKGRISRARHAEDSGAREKMEHDLPGVDVTRLTMSVDAVTDGSWHYLEFGDGRRELYDVAADPAETRNLAAEKPGEAAAMAALLRGRR
jgi:arylsulfatase A-like enzyme